MKRPPRRTTGCRDFGPEIARRAQPSHQSPACSVAWPSAPRHASFAVALLIAVCGSSPSAISQSLRAPTMPHIVYGPLLPVCACTIEVLAEHVPLLVEVVIANFERLFEEDG